MIREVNFELKRAVLPREWHCHKDRVLRRFVLLRTDRAWRWHFHSLADAVAFVQKRGGGTFCTVDGYGCVETVRHLEKSEPAQMAQKLVSKKACQISRDAVKTSRNCEKAKVAHDGAVK